MCEEDAPTAERANQQQVKEEASLEAEPAAAESGHRVLVFAQLKSFLDIVERDVLRPAHVPYLRLDGRQAPSPHPLGTASTMQVFFYIARLGIELWRELVFLNCLESSSQA